MPTALRTATALARSCHPLPSVAVTAVATILAAAADNSAGTCVLLGAAVLAGQLSVGWSNDRIDADRDRRVGHGPKPVADGAVSEQMVDVAIVLSLVATVVLSLLLGWRAGGLQLVAVAAAWAYNAKIKSTLVSWLPYAISFGAVPAIATLALPGHPAPAGWICAVAAIIGTAVNFANALPVLARHPRSDVHGLPDRIGGRASVIVTAVLLIASAALITWLPAGRPSAASWVNLVLTLGLLIVGVPLVWRRADSRAPFYGMLPILAIQLIVLVITARPLH